MEPLLGFVINVLAGAMDGGGCGHAFGRHMVAVLNPDGAGGLKRRSYGRVEPPPHRDARDIVPHVRVVRPRFASRPRSPAFNNVGGLP